MPYKDWNLKANEDENMRKYEIEYDWHLHKEMKGKYYTEDPFGLKNNKFRQYIFNSIFIDYEGDEKYIEDACMTRFVINMRKNAENRN